MHFYDHYNPNLGTYKRAELRVCGGGMGSKRCETRTGGHRVRASLPPLPPLPLIPLQLPPGGSRVQQVLTPCARSICGTYSPCVCTVLPPRDTHVPATTTITAAAATEPRLRRSVSSSTRQYYCCANARAPFAPTTAHMCWRTNARIELVNKARVVSGEWRKQQQT